MNNNADKNEEEEEEGGIPAWMVTFSDLATLLLTFFVLLLSMSSMDDKSLKSLFTNFTSACGILNFKEYGEIYRPKDVLIHGIYQKLKSALVTKRSDDTAEIASETDETFQKMTGNQLILEDFKDGFKLVFGQKLLFPAGSAEMKEEMKSVLTLVANFINSSSYQIYIDGHTDDTPIHSDEYPTNEDLALARAYNIMDYLVNEKGVSPESTAIGGYGEHHPVDSNNTVTGRQNNRRVEMIFKNKKYF